jgi:hypothetical protein
MIGQAACMDTSTASLGVWLEAAKHMIDVPGPCMYCHHRTGTHAFRPAAVSVSTNLQTAARAATTSEVHNVLGLVPLNRSVIAPTV